MKNINKEEPYVKIFYFYAYIFMKIIFQNAILLVIFLSFSCHKRHLSPFSGIICYRFAKII